MHHAAAAISIEFDGKCLYPLAPMSPLTKVVLFLCAYALLGGLIVDNVAAVVTPHPQYAGGILPDTLKGSFELISESGQIAPKWNSSWLDRPLTVYDAVLGFNSVYQLCIQREMTFYRKAKGAKSAESQNQFSWESEESDWFETPLPVFCMLGLRNVGKTYVASQIVSEQLLQGYDVHTIGLSLKVRQVLFFGDRRNRVYERNIDCRKLRTRRQCLLMAKAMIVLFRVRPIFLCCPC